MPRPSMTDDPVAPALFRLVLPMIPGTMSIVLFNLADTYFVGRLGALPLAAMSFSFPVVLISGGLAMGLGIGTSARVSHELGAGHRSTATEIATRAHLLAFTLTTALAAAGLLLIDPLFRLLGADASTLPLIHEYMEVWFVGLPFVVLPMIGMNVLQSTGDTTIPGMVLTSTVLLNVGLDPVLIFGVGPFPEMGIAGVMARDRNHLGPNSEDRGPRGGRKYSATDLHGGGDTHGFSVRNGSSGGFWCSHPDRILCAGVYAGAVNDRHAFRGSKSGGRTLGTNRTQRPRRLGVLALLGRYGIGGISLGGHTDRPRL